MKPLTKENFKTVRGHYANIPVVNSFIICPYCKEETNEILWFMHIKPEETIYRCPSCKQESRYETNNPSD